MEKLDNLLFEAPHHSSVEFSVVGRHLGQIRKYKVTYRAGNTGYKNYTYIGDTPTECLDKLIRKLAHPDCHISFCCCCSKQPPHKEEKNK
jgi:hypothetical protein